MITDAEAMAAKPKDGKEISLSDGKDLYLSVMVNGDTNRVFYKNPPKTWTQSICIAPSFRRA
ncbi:MAG: hypothetical protein MR571_03440 [Succinatimonas sp.]|nr:hypothetical protein [Succinatimonas sp.]